MKHLFSIVRICCLISCAGLSAAALAEDAETVDAAKNGIRVGTFDSRLVATAYVRSALFHERLAKMQSELKAAKASNNDERVKQLELKGAELQAVIHKQGFSTWPVHDILQSIHDKLPGIASKAKVDLIVSKWDVAFQREGVNAVDVTDLLVAPFNPDEETKKVLESLRSKKPVPLTELTKHK